MTIAVNLLPGERPARVLKERIGQMHLFGLSAKLGPKAESIIGAMDMEAVSQERGCLPAGKYRTAAYAAYRSYPKAPLGREITWMEGGNFYHHSVPDVPVLQGDKEISLRKAIGMAVYDSIGLLQVKRDCSNVFTVFAPDLSALEGKVRVIDFIRNSWAYPDEHGFPLQRLRTLQFIGSARFGHMIEAFNDDSTGWHGSIARVNPRPGDPDAGRHVYASDAWSYLCRVAVAGPAPAAQLKTG